MIAQRMGHRSVRPASGIDNLSHALRQFGAPLSRVHGQWHRFSSDEAALHSVLAEIGETVLARRTQITGQETGASVVLTITNRHLAQIEGVNFDENEPSAASVVAAVGQVLAGNKTLKFDVIDRSPELPKSSRSWTFDALVEAMQHGTQERPSQTSGIHDLIAEIKALSLAWARPEIGQNPAEAVGQNAPLEILERCLAHRARSKSGAPRLAVQRPTLSVMPIPHARILVLLESPEEPICFVCEAAHMAAIIAIWQAYLELDALT